MELKATDLRIGNYIEIEGNYFQCCVYDLINIETNNRAEAKPIELSSDILLKAGFEYDEICWFKRNIMLAERKSGGYNVFYGTLTHGKLDECIITSLHQLQNCFYYLSGGTELHINI